MLPNNLKKKPMKRRSKKSQEKFIGDEDLSSGCVSLAKFLSFSKYPDQSISSLLNIFLLESSKKSGGLGSCPLNFLVGWTGVRGNCFLDKNAP